MRIAWFGLSTLLVFILLISTTAFAQLRLDSTFPANGATNVSTTVDIQLVFSAALDTNYRVGHDDDDDDSYLAIELFPEDTTENEVNVEINAGLDSVTAFGIQLEPDTRYTLFLTGAKSLTGELLDRPYVTTFTTGATLPTGAVSGEVTFPGGDPTGAAVALFEPGEFGDDIVAIAVANSPFTISFVPDGVYTLMALKDLNQDGELEMENGDAFGVYDGNGDGVADTFVVANGDTTTAIDLEISIPVPRTARHHLPAVETTAQNWASDATLAVVEAGEINPGGEAVAWRYVFSSQTLASYRGWVAISGVIFPTDFEDFEFPDSPALPAGWIDSDSAATVAEANGGADFRTDYPDAETWAGLHPFFGPPPGFSAHSPTSKWLPGHDFPRRFGAHTSEKTAGSRDESEATWFFGYYSHEHDKFLEVALNALTGELLFSSMPNTARERHPAAKDIAAEWSADAELIEVGTFNIGRAGLARDWEFVFYSASKDSVLKVFTYHDGAHREVWPGHDAPTHEPLPPDWIDSPEAASVAEANSDNFRDRHPDEHWVNAHLSRFHPDRRAIWRFEFGAHDGSDQLTVGIDAVTGDLLFRSTPNTARERLPVAEDIANQWSADAELIELGAFNIGPGGLARDWEFGFYSAAKDSVLKVQTQPEGGHHEVWPGHHMPSHNPLPPDWIDSPAAAEIAEQNSDDFRERYLDQHWVNAHLTRGYVGDDRAIWWFEFGSHDGMDHLRIGIDAVTGEVVHQEGPLRFVASAPAHGATNVPTLATFSLEFTAPLDTFAHSMNDILGVEFFPPDSVGEPGGIEFSPDLKTVTAHDLPLTANTRFTALLTNARGLHGQYLERPHVITFTTGAALPTGAVSGEVVVAEHEDGSAVVVLFGKDVFHDKVGGVGIANSPYAIDFVEDGIYLPVGFRFREGPEFGFFDPDGDGSPDTIVVANGDSVSGVDIEFRPPPLRLAREQAETLEAASQLWSADAVLVSVASEGVNPDGTAPNWVYIFYSATLDDFNAFFMLGGFVLPAEFHGGPLGPLPIPDGWIDSDDAIEVAENNGGADFRSRHERHHVFGFLSNHEEGGDTLNMPAVAKNGIPLLVGKRWRSYTEFLQSRRANEEAAVWFFSYFEDTGEWLDVAVDALTGELIFVSRPETARERLPLAEATVAGWAADAALVNLGANQIGPDGLSQDWRFIYYSSSKDSVLVVETYQGNSLSFFTNPPADQPSLQPLPLDWKDSPDVAHIAEDASEHFRRNHPDIWVDAILSYGLLDGHDALWVFRYMSFATQDTFHVAIDAVTGALVTGVADDVAGGLPKSFALEQNFPNPFNPETTIKYDLAADSFVELTVFNLLGQRVRALVSEKQPAGAYRRIWDGRDDAGRQMPSGLYIYRLKAATFSQTRKMIFLK